MEVHSRYDRTARGGDALIVGVLQARCASRRLPGKVLADVLGEPLIGRQLERLGRSARLERVVVATSDDASDDPLAAWCARRGVACHRGAVDDVLARVLAAAGAARHVVRATADCPLCDPTLVDRVVEQHLAGDHDYTSNALVRTFPDGLDVEVVRSSALRAAAREARLPSEREHVTPFLYGHPERFSLGSVEGAPDLSHLRWTVDEPADLAFVRAVYGALYPRDAAFTTADVLALLAEHPELARLNAGIATNEGYARSLAEDPS